MAFSRGTSSGLPGFYNADLQTAKAALGVLVVVAGAGPRRGLFELEQDAPRPLGVNERDERPASPDSRLAIDQRESALFESCQSGAEVGHGDADVMQPLSSPFEKLGHTGIRGERRDELDTAGTLSKERNVDELVSDPFSSMASQAEHVLIESHRGVEVVDRDGNVVQHGRRGPNPLPAHSRSPSLIDLPAGGSSGETDAT